MKAVLNILCVFALHAKINICHREVQTLIECFHLVHINMIFLHRVFQMDDGDAQQPCGIQI